MAYTKGDSPARREADAEEEKYAHSAQKLML